jgi:hypothetical protein
MVQVAVVVLAQQVLTRQHTLALVAAMEVPTVLRAAPMQVVVVVVVILATLLALVVQVAAVMAHHQVVQLQEQQILVAVAVELML